MFNRLQKLLGDLTARRVALLDAYLACLETDTWDNEASMAAVNAAGRLHDIDRHITNVQLEIRRAEQQVKEEAHAS